MKAAFYARTKRVLQLCALPALINPSKPLCTIQVASHFRLIVLIVWITMDLIGGYDSDDENASRSASEGTSHRLKLTLYPTP